MASSSAMASSSPTPMDLSNLPCLPGYGFRNRKKNHHKAQTFNVVAGIRIEQQEGVTYEKPKLVKFQAPVDPRRHGTLPRSTTTEDFAQAQAREHTELPAWDALDRHVLRFYGFFKEGVVESNLENHRVRQCVIFYYLEDDTCHIIEKRQDNSGIPQGQLIRRHRFPGPDGGYLSWQDLQVGGMLQIYGRNICLVDCDPWSRDFYLTQGMEQAHPLHVEGDNFGRSQERGNGPHGIQKTAERVYRETTMGGGHVNADMQQFMEWDRKVCRFYAVMDDLTLPEFERRPFEILYFLADDTVEIREKYPLNAGRDNFPIYYRRSKMEKGRVDLRGPLVPLPHKDAYIHIRDFSVGRNHELMGQQFYIYDADEFTRQYFQQELGMRLADTKDVQLPERAVPKPATPPYNGFGSWDDSMSSVTNLIPKAPRKDYQKLFDHDGKILRFTAQLVNPKPEDAERLFVVNFYLFDDCLSIHEPPQRNIGIVTGKFLEKGVHANQITGELFKPEDLYPGAIIKCHNREFEILDMDEYTRKYFANVDDSFRYDLAAVLEKIRENMRQQFPLVRDIFRRFDADHDGVMTVDEFRQALGKWGFQCSDKEVFILMKHFDTRQDGQVSYNEFCDALLDEDYTADMIKTKAPLNAEYDPEYAAKASRKAAERAETTKVRDAVRAIGDVIYKHAQAFGKIFKEFALMTHLNTVSVHQIQDALQQIGFTFNLDDVVRTVLFVMPHTDLEQVNYVEFLRAMVTSYHEMCAVR